MTGGISLPWNMSRALTSRRCNRRCQNRFRQNAALKIVNDLLLGLHYAHEKKDSDGRALGIVHRDVSPQNVLLSSDGLVKLTDFGIAKDAGTKTQAGAFKGKFAYMAPEQALGRATDRRTDFVCRGADLPTSCSAGTVPMKQRTRLRH